uniref:Cytochrome c oxidase subunit 5A, mitochondrial n=1 Tax=Panstrongylus lignarius TaxID=156445 RepID=A0A224XN39_9HEMI
MARSLYVLGKTLRAFYLGGVMQQRLSHNIAWLVAREDDEEFDCKYETYFNRADIDGWEVRKGMNDIYGMDLVPEPKIIIAALRACRRINDYALAIRFLEAVKFKCGPHVKQIYPWIVEEIKPALEELGIETPEQLCYDKPELHLPNVYLY